MCNFNVIQNYFISINNDKNYFVNLELSLMIKTNFKATPKWVKYTNDG